MGRNDRWWADAVVYQIYPRSFADSDGDGIGDLRGIIGRLDHLTTLGVDVVWLSPIYPSPQDDNGYDISDYTDVDPTFGTLADLDELIAALHDRGMALVMDLVVNHTSDQHPWFVASRSSPEDPKRDWYWWRPPRPGMQAGAPGAEPTNWRSHFSGPAWTLDPATGEYHLHLFSRTQPDLNWENPEVRAAIADVVRWWLDRGVDGFRMDVINMISKRVGPDGALRDGAVQPWSSPLGDGGPEFLDGPRVHEFLQELSRAALDGRRTITVGETPGVTVEEAVRYTDPPGRELDMVFQFEHVQLDQEGGDKWAVRPLRLTDLKATFGRWQAGLAERGWNSLYWDNHDQPRVVSRFGDDRPPWRAASATCLATLLHLHRGTPFIYQGEELGMANFPFTSIHQVADIESRRHHADAVARGEDPEAVMAAIRARGRDNARTPMQWDASPDAGFTTGTPWLAVNPDHVEVNAAAQVDDPNSVFAHHRRLIALRHELDVVVQGEFAMLLPDDEQVYAFTRTWEDVQLLVLCNVSGVQAQPAVPDVGAWAAAEVLLANLPDAPAARWPGGDRVHLRPWEALVLRRAAVG
jgi:oligo-1,6-glucosidase